MTVTTLRDEELQHEALSQMAAYGALGQTLERMTALSNKEGEVRDATIYEMAVVLHDLELAGACKRSNREDRFYITVLGHEMLEELTLK